MVVENNAITLRKSNNRLLKTLKTSVSLSTIAHILKHHLQMKQIYRVPFERNSQRVKDKLYEYVQVSNVVVLHSWNIRLIDVASELYHTAITMFTLISENHGVGCKSCPPGTDIHKWGWIQFSIIGQRAIIEVSDQREGNVTICAAMSHNGVLHCHATLGPYTLPISLISWTLYMTIFFRQSREGQAILSSKCMF